jgi:hypothetical protein
MSGQAGNHGTVVTKNFYTNYLKATYVDDGSTANNKLVANTADAIYGAVATSNITDVYAGNMYPDQITPLQNATATFYYNTTLTKIGAVRSTMNAAKVVYFGVGLEMVQNADVRNDILKKTYDWFMLDIVGMEEKTGNATATLGQNYPNPANDQTTIELSGISRDMMLEVTDITGRVLLSKKVEANSTRIQVSTSNLQPGIYMYRLVSDGKTIGTRKLSIHR